MVLFAKRFGNVLLGCGAFGFGIFKVSGVESVLLLLVFLWVRLRFFLLFGFFSVYDL